MGGEARKSKEKTAKIEGSAVPYQEEREVLIQRAQVAVLIPGLPVNDPPEQFAVLGANGLCAVGAHVDRVLDGAIKATDLSSPAHLPVIPYISSLSTASVFSSFEMCK